MSTVYVLYLHVSVMFEDTKNHIFFCSWRDNHLNKYKLSQTHESWRSSNWLYMHHKTFLLFLKGVSFLLFSLQFNSDWTKCFDELFKEIKLNFSLPLNNCFVEILFSRGVRLVFFYKGEQVIYTQGHNKLVHFHHNYSNIHEHINLENHKPPQNIKSPSDESSSGYESRLAAPPKRKIFHLIAHLFCTQN